MFGGTNVDSSRRFLKREARLLPVNIPMGTKGMVRLSGTRLDRIVIALVDIRTVKIGYAELTRVEGLFVSASYNKGRPRRGRCRSTVADRFHSAVDSFYEAGDRCPVRAFFSSVPKQTARIVSGLKLVNFDGSMESLGRMDRR